MGLVQPDLQVAAGEACPAPIIVHCMSSLGNTPIFSFAVAEIDSPPRILDALELMLSGQEALPALPALVHTRAPCVQRSIDLVDMFTLLVTGLANTVMSTEGSAVSVLLG